MTETPSYRRLYRSRSDKMIAGVCGGIARYLNVDPAAVRVLFAIFAVFTWGTALVAYGLMWLVVPEEPAPADPRPTTTADVPSS